LRVLAIDYGRARTGLAVSDPTGTVARPLAVVAKVRSRGGMAELLERISASAPERIVVGLPLTLRAQHGPQALETLEFVSELRRRCTIPIETYDERFTTALATRTSTPSRSAEDARAAAHLLEGYLRRLAG
jgi:putative holliday junction resolvase